jgi:hypothetical protein|tara:strand:+ start:246 stop:365 length:120 start_codon:yes stop_codon:yes gene_type:complete
MISKPVRLFVVVGFVVITSLLLYKFIIWGKVVFAPYTGA